MFYANVYTSASNKENVSARQACVNLRTGRLSLSLSLNHLLLVQLYVPVSNALGLGSSFRELEELGYKTIFPQTYSNMALWHRDVRATHLIVVQQVPT